MIRSRECGLRVSVSKAEANVRKHDVDFLEASTVSADPLAPILDDPDHSADESREIIVGHSMGQRLLIVSFAERGKTVGRLTGNFVSGSAQPGRESEMKADADQIDGTMTMLATEDAREMCFSQGKSCVYASDDDRFIISETPAGVVDRHELATGEVTRIWPDGTEESFPADSPKYREHPVWPRPATAACRRPDAATARD